MRDEIGEAQALNVGVVTMGQPAEAAEFCRAAKLPFRCLSDPARASYRAYGLRRGGNLDLFGPAALAAGARAALGGHFVGRPVGDVYQLGGVFLVGTDDRVRYAFYPRHAGDQPAPGTFTRLAADPSATKLE